MTAKKTATSCVEQTNALLPVERIGQRILVIRAVKRNLPRFPNDFVFQLNSSELRLLRCQIGTSKGRGGRRTLPHVFTEHGAIMLASVLNSERAIEASIFVVRAFVKLRSLLATQKEIAQKLSELERKLTGHDEDIKTLFIAIRQLMTAPEPKRKRIGFHSQPE